MFLDFCHFCVFQSRYVPFLDHQFAPWIGWPEAIFLTH